MVATCFGEIRSPSWRFVGMHIQMEERAGNLLHIVSAAGYRNGLWIENAQLGGVTNLGSKCYRVIKMQRRIQSFLDDTVRRSRLVRTTAYKT
jgi:hypothetical protein